MIVNQIKEGWEIIHHQAHGLLAAQLAHQFPKDRFPEGFYTDVIAAILCHDDYQEDYKHNNYVTDVGAPRDFTLAKSNKTEKYLRTKRVIKAAHEKSAWVGMLIAFHFNFLYQDAEGLSKRLVKLLKKEKKASKKRLKKMGFNYHNLEKTYQIMRLCDRCSLILTRNNIPEMGRNLEIMTNLEDERTELYLNKKGQLVVLPWCFQEDKFSVNVEAHILEQLEFKNDKQLEKAIKNAETKRKIFEFVKE